MNAKQQFSRNLFLKEQGECCVVRDFGFDRVLLKQSLSPFKYFCPVTWLTRKQIFKCTNNVESCVLYKEKFYYFRSEHEQRLFIENPGRFISANNFPKDIPIILRNTKAAELHRSAKALQGHCPVALTEGQRVQPGDHLLVIKYADLPFVFESQESMLKFFHDPSKYAKA